MHWLARYVPILDWAPKYTKKAFADDLVAAIIVTIMLIPQSLAYALLAGLPVEAGLYASITPLMIYAVFGTSRSLSVGPVAVVSLMTAAAIGEVAQTGTTSYVEAALMLALLSGLILLFLGVFRVGFLANLLSHPVISGFITASAIIIAASQLRHILGINAQGHTLYDVASSLLENIAATNMITLTLGSAVIGFLFFVRKAGRASLQKIGIPKHIADPLAKAGPILAVATSILAVSWFSLAGQGVAIVGPVPAGLPTLTFPSFDLALAHQLLLPAIFISLIGFVESISVAQTLAARKRQSIQPDQELLGLGFANIASGLSGGYPVTGGFARSVVNFDAGANTQAAGAFAGLGIAVATTFFTPLLHDLPNATLAATIIVAVLSLVDVGAIKRTWRFSKTDSAAMLATIAITLAMGVEIGVVTGVAVSLALHLFRSSRPHTAVVGRVPGTEHFRNINRHSVETHPQIVTLRVDESLYFANARFLEDEVCRVMKDHPQAQHFILMCPAVNTVDASALESLELINSRLKDAGITFHLSEVKGPVMDRLKRSHFLDELTGQVFLSQDQAERGTMDLFQKQQTENQSEKIHAPV